MKRGEKLYIWEEADWPVWRYDLAQLAGPLAEVSRAQGSLIGRLADVGMLLRDQASLAALTEDVVKTSEIEGEMLNADSVRSSIARHLGVDIGALAALDRDVEGVVDMVLDATGRASEALSEERLFEWHAGLFPQGRAASGRVRVGAWRDDEAGPMQVVSGPVHKPKVHYEAPPARALAQETAAFLGWANASTPEPALIKSAIAHLWFVTLHPFDDGNGRVARALGDLFIARADGSPQRFYSLSAQIQRERRDYYDILERAQKGTMDITGWLAWFLAALHRAIDSAEMALGGVLLKAHFWRRWAETSLNARQVKVLNRLLDGFEGKLNSSKWAAIAKCSPDTALRDINELLELGVLRRAQAGGRSTSYALNDL